MHLCLFDCCMIPPKVFELSNLPINLYFDLEKHWSCQIFITKINRMQHFDLKFLNYLFTLDLIVQLVRPIRTSIFTYVNAFE